MAYLGDIRENSISPEGIIWENDNRKDARYYWNGAFVDLCDLPGEDYAKTIFVTTGSGGSSTSKVINPISVQQVVYTNENGNKVYAYKVMSKQPVTSNVTVDLTVVDEMGAEENVTITLMSGTSSSEVYPTTFLATMAPPKIVTSDYNPKEDEKFEYNTVLPEDDVQLPITYSITLLIHQIENISDEDLIKLLNENTKVESENNAVSKKFTVKFQKFPVEGLSDMSIPEMTDALIKNSQDIVFVTNGSIKSIEQADVAGINEISLWNKKETPLILNGKTYTVWYKRDEGQTSQSKIYDTVTNEVIGTEDRDYIIYYE